MLILEAVAYDGADATQLMGEVQAEYVIRYGGPDDGPIDATQFAPPDGAFLLARVDDAVIGCGGLRRLDDTTAEIKRMFVRAPHRRRGHGRRLLLALEQHARLTGYDRVVLETGTAQPEAMALYAQEGYHPITPYGFYRCSPESRCFAKHLAPAHTD